MTTSFPTSQGNPLPLFLGTAALDMIVTVEDIVAKSQDAKVLCRIATSAGGGPVNAALAYQAVTGHSPRLAAIFTNDPSGKIVMVHLEKEGLSGWCQVNAIDSTRTSLIVPRDNMDGQRIYTSRSSVNIDQALAHISRLILPKQTVYVGPLDSPDYPLVLETFRMVRELEGTSYLALSGKQLGDEHTFDLIRQATWTQLNASEMLKLVPQATSVERALWYLREEHGIHSNLLVTLGSNGILASMPGNDGCYYEGFAVPVVKDRAAGDIVSGVFVAGLAAGRDVTRQLLKHCCAAAALSISGQRVGDWTQLDQFSASTPTRPHAELLATLERPDPTGKPNQWKAAAAVVGAGTAIAVSLAMLIF